VRSGVKRLAISAARAKDGEIGSLIPMFFLVVRIVDFCVC